MSEVKINDTYQYIFDASVPQDKITQDMLDMTDAVMDILTPFLEETKMYKFFDRMVIDFTKDSRH